MHAGLNFDRVDKSYGDTKAIDGLSLDVSPGEVVAVSGPSGERGGCWGSDPRERTRISVPVDWSPCRSVRPKRRSGFCLPTSAGSRRGPKGTRQLLQQRGSRDSINWQAEF